MATITLTLPVAGTVITAGLHANNYTAIQTAINGGLDTNNISGSAGIKGSQLATGLNGPPGTELAYAEFTASVQANTIAEAAATQIVSAGAFSFDGATAVIVEFFCPALVWGGAGTTTTGINLWDGATDLGRLFDGTTVAQPVADMPCGVLKRKLTPSNASHTYSARIWSATATNFQAVAGAGGVGVKLPGYIRITKA